MHLKLLKPGEKPRSKKSIHRAYKFKKFMFKVSILLNIALILYILHINKYL